MAAETAVARAAPFLPAAQMPAQRGEIPSLDGLRALSILLVMCTHFISGKVFPGGLGVLVFFVISGFLITRLLLHEFKQTGTVRLGPFYARRLLRLYPVIIVYTAVVTGLAIERFGKVSLGEICSALFYYANYYFEFGRADSDFGYVPVSILWSLAIEEHFYIVFPLLLLLLARDVRLLLAGMLVVMVAALGLRLHAAHAHPEYLTSHFFYFRTEMRMDSLATGVLMAALCELRAGRFLLLWANRPAAVAGALAAVLFCLLFRDLWFRETLRYSILNLAVAVAIAAVLFSNRYPLANAALNSPVLVSVGRLSYSLYVWHLGIGFAVAPLGVPFWPKVAVLFLLSFLTAYLSYDFVEAPFMRLRHRFGSVKRQASPLSAFAPTRRLRREGDRDGV